ncbi:hypothetical protein OGAPHI_006720 [Ogataea philodendri]|uniref:Uncharacterized protein n=1 Tax=Ogataea philodendri TaxID=1378263 RepID=A0A9P8NVZ8_9ASCO|nr:uncharacterized protein OGAPHI_006720 [Ogataea philodendri]KAH3661313.1 hypothetical protein OGAPHI_006720 [Ogataea philodendri]
MSISCALSSEWKCCDRAVSWTSGEDIVGFPRKALSGDLIRDDSDEPDPVAVCFLTKVGDISGSATGSTKESAEGGGDRGPSLLGSLVLECTSCGNVWAIGVDSTDSGDRCCMQNKTALCLHGAPLDHVQQVVQHSERWSRNVVLLGHIQSVTNNDLVLGVVTLSDVDEHRRRVPFTVIGPDHEVDDGFWQVHAVALGNGKDLFHGWTNDRVDTSKQLESANVHVGERGGRVDRGVVHELSPSRVVHVLVVDDVVLVVAVEINKVLTFLLLLGIV